MIRPFYFETQKTVKPFSIDPKMIDEKSDCHCHTCITSDCSEIPMKVPFYFLREDVGEIAAIAIKFRKQGRIDPTCRNCIAKLHR